MSFARIFSTALFALGLTGLAAAQTATYSLNATAVSQFGTGPYGTVTLTQSGQDVWVNVALSSELNFISTGNLKSHSIFAFNVIGATASDISNISFANGLSATFDVAHPAADSPFGQFTYGIYCAQNCPSGGSLGGYADPLNFKVTNATISEFANLSTSGNPKAYFAADVLRVSAPNAGATGAVGAISPGVIAAVPEPETYAMLLAGLGLMGALVRRRKSNPT